MITKPNSIKVNLGRYKILSVLFGLAVLAVVVFKAYSTSFTHDESYSYLHYTDESFMEIITFNNWYTNNHVLNSLLMKYSQILFGNSEFALRLPNVLGLLIYMFYAYKICKAKESKIGFSIYVILISNCMLMDLFGMARGYGLSCAFMMMMFYHLEVASRERRMSHIALFHLSGVLAILSNFTLLTVYASALLAYLIREIFIQLGSKSRKENVLSIIKMNFIPFAVGFALLYEPVRRAVTRSDLGFGGKNGFFEDTVSQLILNTFQGFGLPFIVELVLMLIIVGVVLFSLIRVVKTIRTKDEILILQENGLILITFINLGVSFAIVSAHLLLGSDYPVARFSIFLFPLLILQIGFFVSSVSMRLKMPNLGWSYVLIGLLYFTSFWIRTSFHSNGEWAYDCSTKEMMQNLKSKISPSESQVQLGLNWQFAPAVKYYTERMQLSNLKPVDRTGVRPDDDYRYLFVDEEVNSDEFKPMRYFASSKSVLYKRIQK